MNQSWGKWFRSSLLVVLALMFATVVVRTVWLAMEQRVPGEIRIATGKPTGMYHFYAQTLKEVLQAKGRNVVLVSTDGTIENVELLRSRQVDLAMAQSGVISLHGVAVVAPLAREVAQIVVRKSSGIKRISDLKGKRIVLGLPNSGMRACATQILQHYRIPLSEINVREDYFGQLLHDPALDGAIITTGYENRDLQAVLETAAFEILPIDDASALVLKHPHFQRFEIPQGLHRASVTQAPTPAAATETVATTALLVCRPDAPSVLVREVLDALYDDDLQEKLSGLLPRDEALRSTRHRWHKEAREFFSPFDQIGYLANVMESLSAIKDLFWATGGLIGMAYLIWRKRQRKHLRNQLRAKRQQHRERSQLFKDLLDEFLKETIVIEQELSQTNDPKTLEAMLQKISEVKLRALNELTEETLRGNRMFLIFLQQCGHLSQAVRGKIWLTESAGEMP
jgi:TRAP transporter TAXI family solute receptor